MTDTSVPPCLRSPFCPSFLPRSGIVSTRCRPGRPRDPSFTGRLSPTPPPSGGSRGIEPPRPLRDHVWRGLLSRVARVIQLAPGGGGGGVCRYNGLRPKPCGSRGWYGARGLTPPPYSVGCPWGANWGSGFGQLPLDPWLWSCGLHCSTASGGRGSALSLSPSRLTPVPFRFTPLPVDDVPGFPGHRRNCPT